jgi:hypothetical protein
VLDIPPIALGEPHRSIKPLADPGGLLPGVINGLERLLSFSIAQGRAGASGRFDTLGQASVAVADLLEAHCAAILSG